MRPVEQQAAEWRDSEAYAPLLDADRSILAWEWLRRDPAYRSAAAGAGDSREGDEGGARAWRWGLVAFEAPGRSAPKARPLWAAQRHSSVLAVRAGPATRAEDAFDIADFASLSTLVRSERGEYLLISDGLRTIRLDVLKGTLSDGPVELRYHLSGIASAEPPLMSLRRLLALRRLGGFSAALHPRWPRAGRMVTMLRAYDAAVAGWSQREIAAELLAGQARAGRWRVESPSLRLRAQRLVRCARTMAAGGFWSLLD